jgi:hypothetical protein
MLFIFAVLPKYLKMRINPIIGQKFGDWEVISENVEKYKRWYKYNVRCKCGFETFILANTLRRGKSTCCKSCGNEKHYKGVGNLSSTFFSRILEGAKKRKIEVSVTKEEILELLEKQEYKCALSGLPLVMSRSFSVDRANQTYSTTASLDRKDSSKGYTLANVQWVHKDINIMKNKYDQPYFTEMCRLVYKTMYADNL